MEERKRNLEKIAQISAEIHRLMEVSQPEMKEALRRLDVSLRRLDGPMGPVEEIQRQLDEMMDRMAQAITLIQADIVRIDETR